MSAPVFKTVWQSSSADMSAGAATKAKLFAFWSARSTAAAIDAINADGPEVADNYRLQMLSDVKRALVAITPVQQ